MNKTVDTYLDEIQLQEGRIKDFGKKLKKKRLCAITRNDIDSIQSDFDAYTRHGVKVPNTEDTRKLRKHFSMQKERYRRKCQGEPPLAKPLKLGEAAGPQDRMMSKLLENFLQSLYTDMRSQAKEWRGSNRPTGDDSNRTNLIRQCFTMESSKMKINCLRKLRDEAAMNPFYQARLDRFVDAITQTYEPTNEPGTIPGNEFKETAVGDDLIAQENVTEATAAEIGWETQKLVWLIQIINSRKGENIYAKKACKSKPSHQRSGKLCRLQAKIKFNQSLISQAQAAKASCSQSKNPEKCKAKAVKQIAKIRKIIANHQRWIRAL